MSKIATEQEAKEIGGALGSVIENKCCTKARAQELGCSMKRNSSSIDSNQLVELDNLQQATIYVTVFLAVDFGAAAPCSGYLILEWYSVPDNRPARYMKNVSATIDNPIWTDVFDVEATIQYYYTFSSGSFAHGGVEQFEVEADGFDAIEGTRVNARALFV